MSKSRLGATTRREPAMAIVRPPNPLTLRATKATARAGDRTSLRPMRGRRRQMGRRRQADGRRRRRPMRIARSR